MPDCLSEGFWVCFPSNSLIDRQFWPKESHSWNPSCFIVCCGFPALAAFCSSEPNWLNSSRGNSARHLALSFTRHGCAWELCVKCSTSDSDCLCPLAPCHPLACHCWCCHSVQVKRCVCVIYMRFVWASPSVAASDSCYCYCFRSAKAKARARARASVLADNWSLSTVNCNKN